VRPDQCDDLIVGVNRLRRFAFPDADRGETGDEATVVENTFDDRQQHGIDGNLREGLPVGQKIVDAHRLMPLEIVLRRLDSLIALDFPERLADRVEQVFRDDTFQNRVALIFNFTQCMRERLFAESLIRHTMQPITP
jgi:hypothetical protein